MLTILIRKQDIETKEEKISGLLLIYIINQIHNLFSFAFMLSHETIVKKASTYFIFTEMNEMTKTQAHRVVFALYLKIKEATGQQSTSSMLGEHHTHPQQSCKNIYEVSNLEAYNLECVPADMLGKAAKRISKGKISDGLVLSIMVAVSSMYHVHHSCMQHHTHIYT